MHLEWTLVLAVALLIAALPVGAVTPTAKEIATAHEWTAARFGDHPTAAPPFSFTYDGRPSSEFIKTWKAKRTSRKIDKARTEITNTYTDPITGLVVTCRAIEYADFPTVEWVVYLKNTGKADTPIIENIQSLDISVQRKPDQPEYILHHNQGSLTQPSDFQPFTDTLAGGTEKRIVATGGRPMNGDMPYFNLQWGNEGMIVVISWLGNWTSLFARNTRESLHIAAGQEITRFKLHPGEQVRTPLIALQFYQGDVVRSQNVWRRWMIAHNLPRPGGKPFPPILSTGTDAGTKGFLFGADTELADLKALPTLGIKFDYWWHDAGWYPCGADWYHTGTWECDPQRYPKGLREIADAAHAQGMKFTVWFEPERAFAGSWLYTTHPDWLLGPPNESSRVLDLGNPEAFKWLVDHISKLIVDNHIDMYRQDYNIDPIGHWRYGEAEDRQGITEIRQVEGLLAYWDALKARFPNMPFDNCASGGRRNVLEMMRLGVPLSKTDYGGGTTSTQCQVWGLAPWLPYFGGGIDPTNLYQMRSNISPWTATCWIESPKLNVSVFRKFIAEWRQIIPYYWGDFYPLTPYSLEENVWMAWQYDMPEKGAGIVQAFRRDQATEESQLFKLRGLDPKATYTVRNFDTGTSEKATGKKLIDEGLRVTITTQPGAALIEYRKTK